jgi:uncharacterized repeat protein (TIGR01451 family)
VNQGPDDATGVVVTDTLPVELTYVSDNAGGAYDGATGIWTIGDLAVGATVSMQFVATVDAAGTFVNEAEVTAANEEDSDSVPGDGEGDDWDDAIVTASVDPVIIDLELVKDVDPALVEVGAQTTFSISVVNQGPDDATGVVVTDTLPDGLTYVSDNAGGAYDGATGIWTIGDLAVGASVAMDFVVTVDDTGIFTNVAEVTAANETDIDSVPGDGEGDDWDNAVVTTFPSVLVTAEIGDYVWYDQDEDQIQDSDELPVQGAIVTLTNEGTGATSTMVTNSAGRYLFTAVDPGEYTVTVSTAGLDDTNYAYTLTTVGEYTVTVLDIEELQQFLDNDFGIARMLIISGMEIETAALIGLLFLGLGGLMLGLEQGRRRLREPSLA